MGKRLTTLAAVPVLALALVAAGCGGSASSTGTTTATTTTTGTVTNGRGAAANAAFRSCLAKQGVTLPSGFGNGQRPPNGSGGQPPQGNGQPPQGGGQPGLSAKQQKAFATCRSKLPNGGRGGFPSGGRNNPALTKYTNCLRKHGVTLGASNNQSAFKKASAACAQYAPTPGG